MPPILSPRERQVFYLLREGKSNQDIASELGLSINTVKVYVSKILLKLGATSRLHAIATYRGKTLPPSPPSK